MNAMLFVYMSEPPPSNQGMNSQFFRKLDCYLLLINPQYFRLWYRTDSTVLIGKSSNKRLCLNGILSVEVRRQRVWSGGGNGRLNPDYLTTSNKFDSHLGEYHNLVSAYIMGNTNHDKQYNSMKWKLASEHHKCRNGGMQTQKSVHL